MIVAFVLALAGFYTLCAAMARHRGSLLPKRLPIDPRGLRRAGAVALGLSWIVALRAQGLALGTLTWFGLASVSAATVLLLANRHAAKRLR